VFDELIKSGPHLSLGAERRATAGGWTVVLRFKGTGNPWLHWGLSHQHPAQWQAPPASLWPPGTKAFNAQAVQTPFPANPVERDLVLHFNEPVQAPFLVFDLFFPDTNRWENNLGKDFYMALSGPAPCSNSPAATLENEVAGTKVLFQNRFRLDSGAELAAAVMPQSDGFQVLLITDAAGPLALHWGLTEQSRTVWRFPPESVWPKGTTVFGETSVQTPFRESNGLRRLSFHIPEPLAPKGLGFVLHQIQSGQWLKQGGQNLTIPILPPPTGSQELSALGGRIAAAETGAHGWSLMHRFNLCQELIAEAGSDRENWATLFVWLRFSAIRQLDWQRNYNTKPRELSHAQDRLTASLTTAYLSQPSNRDLIALMFGCLGRGGDGQRIRDEILHIMHRHHIKEVGGTWMEQWHQKLHNNTTPDDVVICEAYLAFLQSGGDLNRYKAALAAGGVAPERLAGFERPITKVPEWHPHLRDGLLHDFHNYLKLLKSVHSGTDLETAANAAHPWLDAETNAALSHVRHLFHAPGPSPLELSARITGLRQTLQNRLEARPAIPCAKELIYLDLALEQTLRTVIERSLNSGFDRDSLLKLIQRGVENLLLLPSGEELLQCQREVQRLPTDNRSHADWSLHAKAALDRLRRAVETQIDSLHQLLQPRGEALGHAFQADDWVVRLFAEEIVRGQPVFVLSMLLHHLDPILRQQAKLGNWQVISPSQAVGRVEVVASFRDVQGRIFESPTVIVAEKVFGDEEPPENVHAVITPSSVDLVSHVAVRARNVRILFATCYDRACFESLQALKGQTVELRVAPGGDVLFSKTTAKSDSSNRTKDTALAPKSARARPVLQALPLSGFSRQQAGGKSWHLKELADKLPDWLQTPRSVVLPFGVFDAVLETPANRSLAARYAGLIAQIGSDPQATLASIRQCLLELQLPDALQKELYRSLREAGLPEPQNRDLAETRVKQVWASLWNDRAYFSRETRGWPHTAVQMAVLIQEVVEAEYAFVLHTVNPFTGDRGEVYAEVVRGLGETVVGNYPGRALSLTGSKESGAATILAYPAKSSGLFGRGLIFRSDSNAEDLAGYAGAGLYDSVLLEPPAEECLDYTGDKLVWDEAFRLEFAAMLTRIGTTVEEAFGAPQDIEGAWSKGKFYIVQTRPQVGL